MWTHIKLHLARFRAEEDGAATVDWVVGTAVAVTMSLAVTNAVGDGVMALSQKVSDSIAGFEMCWGAACPPKD